MRWMMVGVAGLALAGCAHTRSGPAPASNPKPIPVEAESITYETGPCFGACPVYSVTVRPDGSGVFTGKRFTAVTGERAFKLSPAEYAAFSAHLSPYRPESGERSYHNGQKGCERWATDLPSVDIVWTRAIGDSQRLHFDFGCNMDKNTALANALGSAPDAIPALEPLIGPRP